MVDLRVEPVADETAIADWLHVHNAVVPPAAMSLDEVRERVTRYHLEVAYVGDVLVGCSTVRPPAGQERTATVIARTLAEHRRQGYGRHLYERALARARALGAERIETVVWSPNVDGLRFAEGLGFVEVEVYSTEPGEAPWVTLALG
jgi:GNAT superfamily N-acetyltransferase